MRRRFDALVSRIAPYIDPLIYRVFAALPLTRFSEDPMLAATYRSQVIWEEAVRRGITMQQMVLLGTYTDIYRARMDDEWFYFQSLPVPKNVWIPA